MSSKSEQELRKQVGTKQWASKVLTTSRRNAKLYNHKPINLDVEELIAFSAQYTGKCDICGIEDIQLKRTLAVDHCHTTGKVRGFICHSCNVMIGKIEAQKISLGCLSKYIRGL